MCLIPLLTCVHVRRMMTYLSSYRMRYSSWYRPSVKDTNMSNTYFIDCVLSFPGSTCNYTTQLLKVLTSRCFYSMCKYIVNALIKFLLVQLSNYSIVYYECFQATGTICVYLSFKWYIY